MHSSRRWKVYQMALRCQCISFFLEVFAPAAANAHCGCLLQVIFLFGEIDCREGLTMAVDKLKYETLEAAMEVLLQIYQGRAACLLCQHSHSPWHSPKRCSVLQTCCWT